MAAQCALHLCKLHAELVLQRIKHADCTAPHLPLYSSGPAQDTVAGLYLLVGLAACVQLTEHTSLLRSQPDLFAHWTFVECPCL